MNVEKILIVPKKSKFELDMGRLKLDQNALREHYLNEGLDSDRIFESHQIQKELLEKLKRAFKGAKFVSRDELTKKDINETEMLISFGGDNHFQYLSHLISDTPIFGINSDPKNSEGALTSYAGEDYEDLANKIKNDNYKIKKWNRLKVSVNGKPVEYHATADIYLGEEKRHMISRHLLEIENGKERQKCSGLLVATKAGSTGWYRSASSYAHVKPFHDDEVRFAVMEPYRGKNKDYSLISGSVKDKIRVHSQNDNHGVIVIDSERVIEFKEGSIAEISRGIPLNVIIF